MGGERFGLQLKISHFSDAVIPLNLILLKCDQPSTYNCYRVQCSQEQLPLKTSHQIPTIELHSGDEDDVKEGDVDKE